MGHNRDIRDSMIVALGKGTWDVLERKDVFMRKNQIDVWENLSAEALIEKMFERTGEDGVLVLPSFFSEAQREGICLRCVMDWKQPGDCQAVLQEFRALRAAIERIAQVCDENGSLEESAYEALPEAQKQVFDVWLRPFPSDEDFDMGCIFEIGERLDAASPEETEYYNRFHAARDEECCRRLGDNELAYRSVLRAMRYHRLLTLHAPDAVLRIEERALAAALALLRRCRDADVVAEK